MDTGVDSGPVPICRFGARVHVTWASLFHLHPNKRHDPAPEPARFRNFSTKPLGEAIS